MKSKKEQTIALFLCVLEHEDDDLTFLTNKAVKGERINTFKDLNVTFVPIKKLKEVRPLHIWNSRLSLFTSRREI